MGKFSRNNDPSSQYAEQMRLDAVKAEVDRKARQKNEVGLPAFPTQEDAYRPLRGGESDEEVTSPYRDAAAAGVAGMGATARPGARREGSASTSTTQGQGYRGGYAQAPPGTRAVDEYYSPSPGSPAPSSAHSRYPPQRQYSGSTSRSPPPAMPGGIQGVGTAAAVAGAGIGAGYLANQAPGNHSQYASSAATYGHTNGGSSCECHVYHALGRQSN